MADVVIADQSEFARDLLRAALDGHHEVVGEAETGVEVVEVAKAQAPEVAILDVELPIRNGVEATEELTAAGVGVVLCSAERDRETVEDGFDAGAAAFVARPFQRRGLLSAIDDALSS